MRTVRIPEYRGFASGALGKGVGVVEFIDAYQANVFSEKDVKIVVLAHSRQESLERCLTTVLQEVRAQEGHSVTVSCDGGHKLELNAIKNNPLWSKDVVVTEARVNQGLRRHMYSLFLRCVEDNEDYLILEDDLILVPGALRYAEQSLIAAAELADVAQISLYNYEFNEIARCRTVRPKTEYSFFRVRQASSWGFAVTPRMAYDFLEWTKFTDKNWALVPKEIAAWPDTSWKKDFNLFLASTRRYVIAPYESYAINMGESGLHKKTRNSYTYSQPAPRPAEDLRIVENYSESLVLDEYLELEKFPQLFGDNVEGISYDDIEFDYFGLKPRSVIKKKYVLTSIPQRSAICTFGLTASDPWLSIQLGVRGKSLALIAASDFRAGYWRMSKMKNLVRGIYWASRGTAILALVLDLVSIARK